MPPRPGRRPAGSPPRSLGPETVAYARKYLKGVICARGHQVAGVRKNASRAHRACPVAVCSMTLNFFMPEQVVFVTATSSLSEFGSFAQRM
jgi:hypothetical protein